jgi:hypothetical protein
LTHPRFVEFGAFPTESFSLLNLFLKILSSSLQSPATLSRLDLNCEIDYEHLNAFFLDIQALDVWTELDSLANNPLYARLREVNVIIRLLDPADRGIASAVHIEDDDEDSEPYDEHWVRSVLPQKLPLLSSKRILDLQILLMDDDY